MLKHYVGENYRQLSDNEVIEEGDEAWNPQQDRWSPIAAMPVEMSVSTMLAVSPFTAIRRQADTITQVLTFGDFDDDLDSDE